MEKKHTPPTAKQRLRIYNKVKKILTIDSHGRRCICDCIRDAQVIFNYTGLNGRPKWDVGGAAPNCMKINFPELYKHKPFYLSTAMYWWSIGTANGFSKRHAVLDEMIYQVQCEIEIEKKEKP